MYWAREIEKIAPRSDRLAWLKVTFRPDWGRFCVWQMFPPGTAPATTWGPDTPLIMQAQLTLGKRVIKLAPDPRFFPILNRQMMTRHAWQLHLATGCYAQPFWVVEGKHGGHKWQFSEEESRLAGMNGYPEDPPEPGSLDYAPLDYRVVDKLAPLDMLRVWNGLSKAKDELDERDLDDQEREALIVGRTKLWDWMKTQVDEAVDDSGVRVTGDPGAGYRDADAGYEEAEEAFITSD